MHTRAEPARAIPQGEAGSRGASRAYPWFITGAASWFCGFGIQGVVFSWLVVGELRAPAEWVGVTQSALMVPSLFFLLVGGAAADRRDRRSLLIGLHALGALLALGLLAAVAAGALSLAILIGYALCMGTVQAFVMPARDSLLSEVAGSNLMRSVTGLTLTQWGAQAAGALIGGQAAWIGTVPALAIQAALIAGGILALRRLAPAPPPVGAHSVPRLSDLSAGLVEVVRSPVLLPVVLLVAAVGVLFIGPFMVVLPLLIRDVYAGGVAELGLLSMAFPLGTILGSVGMLLAGGIRRKGRAQLAALFSGSLCIGAVALGLPFLGTLVAVVLWGVGAAVFMNSGRTLFQQAAPESHRARVLSIYSLGFMGAAGLVGAPLSGVLIAVVGPLATCAISAGGMLAVVAAALGFSRVAQFE